MTEQTVPFFDEAAREAAARALYEGPDQYGRPSSITWAEMLTYGGAFPDNVDHPIAENFREMVDGVLTAALNALPPRSKAILELARLSDEELVDRVEAALNAWRDSYRRPGVKNAVILAALGLPVDEQAP